MTPEDRKLMQQLRDALVRSNNALNVLTATNHQHDAEIIAAADARLAAPVQSHEAWVEQMMGIVTHISELHSRYVNYNTKALHDTWTAKKDELHAHLNNHPAATPELSQADIETIWRAHAPCNIVDYGASANGVNTAFSLLAEYETTTPALSLIAEKMLGMSAQEAVRQHARGMLPLPAFRLNDSQKCPLVVRITDLAELIDKRAAKAREGMVV